MCTACDAGKYLTATGANTTNVCVNCIAGTYSTTVVAFVDETAYTYSTTKGAFADSTCINCPESSSASSGSKAHLCLAVNLARGALKTQKLPVEVIR